MTIQANITPMNLQRRFKDIGIGGVAARWYDANTRRHRLPEMREYAIEVSQTVKDGSAVLEIAPGPGYLAIAIAKSGNFRVVGLDISKDFVKIARKNAEDARVDVDFRHGNATDVPFPENSFAAIVCTAAFKNFKDPLKALHEMHRVLVPKGTALIIDMNRDATDRQIEDYLSHLGASGLDRLLMKFTFKHFLRGGAYNKTELSSLVSRTAFQKSEIREQGIAIHALLTK